PRCSGTNRKVSNLINMVSLARHDVLVVADSDIEVGPDYLGNVVAALQRPGVGAVTCLYHGIAGTTLAGCLASLTINAHFLPSIVFGVACRLANPCFGSTIALKRETLDRIGGFEAFAYCVADDHAIGRAVRDGGSRVAILPCTVGHACDYRSLREFFGHELRCARVIRSIDPIGYAWAVLSNPLPLPLGAIFCSGANGGALFLAFAAVVCRIALCQCAKVGFGLPRQPYWLLPLADIIAFLSFMSGFFGSSVTWRGHRYRILSGQLGEELTPQKRGSERSMEGRAACARGRIRFREI